MPGAGVFLSLSAVYTRRVVGVRVSVFSPVYSPHPSCLSVSLSLPSVSFSVSFSFSPLLMPCLACFFIFPLLYVGAHVFVSVGSSSFVVAVGRTGRGRGRMGV